MGVPFLVVGRQFQMEGQPGNLQTKIQTGRRKEYEFSTLRH